MPWFIYRIILFLTLCKYWNKKIPLGLDRDFSAIFLLLIVYHSLCLPNFPLPNIVSCFSHASAYNNTIEHMFGGAGLERVILHVDINNCYASIECLHRPELHGKPVAVGGDPELRHGIILAKNYKAKACGVKTGEALWQARQKCPDLVMIKPNYRLYLRFARLARKIYADYTDQIRAFRAR